MTAKKLYYKIGEACKLLEIQPYVLRYWETEFPPLRPNKSKSGQRVYGEEDFRMIGRIKELLYDEGYTIAGAKKKLDAELGSGDTPEPKARADAAGEPGEKEPTEAPEPEEPPKEAARSKKPARKKARKAAKKTTSKAAKKTASSAEAARLREAAETALEQAREILALLDKR